MKNAVLTFFGTIIFGIAFGQSNIQSIDLGTKAPELSYQMTDISGKALSLNDIQEKNGVLVIFSCNTCPFVLGWEDRYMPTANWCKKNDVGFVLVNSNEAQRTAQDALSEMAKHAKEKGYDCYYVEDKNHVLADAFGATRTPEVFLFDKEMTLVYKGAIDDNMEEPENVQQSYLANALSNMLAKTTIEPANTKSVGCSIKRLKK